MDNEVFLTRQDTYEVSNWYEKYSEIKNEVIDSLIAARKEQAAFEEEERKALAAKAEEEEKKVRKAFQMWAFKTDDSILPKVCLLYTSPSPRDRTRSRMPSSA